MKTRRHVRRKKKLDSFMSLYHLVFETDCDSELEESESPPSTLFATPSRMICGSGTIQMIDSGIQIHALMNTPIDSSTCMKRFFASLLFAPPNDCSPDEDIPTPTKSTTLQLPLLTAASPVKEVANCDFNVVSPVLFSIGPQRDGWRRLQFNTTTCTSSSAQHVFIPSVEAEQPEEALLQLHHSDSNHEVGVSLITSPLISRISTFTLFTVFTCPLFFLFLLHAASGKVGSAEKLQRYREEGNLPGPKQ